MLPFSPAENIWVFDRKKEANSRQTHDDTLHVARSRCHNNTRKQRPELRFLTTTSSGVRARLRVFNQYYIFVEALDLAASMFSLEGLEAVCGEEGTQGPSVSYLPPSALPQTEAKWPRQWLLGVLTP